MEDVLEVLPVSFGKVVAELGSFCCRFSKIGVSCTSKIMELAYNSPVRFSFWIERKLLARVWA